MGDSVMAKEKNKGGRPLHQLDYETLDNLCEIMCTAEEIANILNIDRDTLSAALKRDGHGGFSAYYKKMSSDGKRSLRRVQHEQALKGNTTMMVWLGKQYLDQTDKQNIDLNANVNVNFNKVYLRDYINTFI